MAQETNGDEDRGSTGYKVEYWVAVGCAAALAALGVASAEADVIGISRQWLGILAVFAAVIGVIAAALPNIRKPPVRAKPPALEPKPPGPDLELFRMVDEVLRRALWQVVLWSLAMLAILLLLGVLLDLWTGMR